MIAFVIVPLVAAVVTYLATPPVMRLAHRWGVVQRPSREQDIHHRPIPRMGGVAIVVGFLVAALVAAALPLPRTDPGEGLRLAGLLVGSLLAGAAGVWDDRVELGPREQFLIQIGLALVALATTIWIKHVNNPFAPGFLWSAEEGFPLLIVIPLTILWFMGAINTVNFLDGLDGLAAGVAAIASLVFALHMWRLGQISVALLPLALLGATLGFLPFNFHPARLFMGSAGSIFLGYALGGLAIIAGAKVASLLLVLAVPILDTAWLIISRWRRGQSPMQGSRDHLHHRLYDAGLSQRQIVLGYWAITALTGALALILPGRLAKFYALTLLALLAFLLLWRLARRAAPQAG